MAALEGKTAVVVDDEPITRIDLCETLGDLGCEVLGSAADGFDAVALCRAQRPSLVLMDVKMPVFDGMAAAETIIQQDLAGCVVLLTAFADDELVSRAAGIGVGGYLLKPVAPQALKATLLVALAQCAQLARARQEAGQGKLQLEEAALVERAKALQARAQGIGEGDALRQLQKLAMDKRLPLAEIARAVVAQQSGREVVNAAKRRLMEAEGLSERAAFKLLQQRAAKGRMDLAAAAREVLDGKA